jgi:hypothetical protein
MKLGIKGQNIYFSDNFQGYWYEDQCNFKFMGNFWQVEIRTDTGTCLMYSIIKTHLFCNYMKCNCQEIINTE